MRYRASRERRNTISSASSGAMHSSSSVGSMSEASLGSFSGFSSSSNPLAGSPMALHTARRVSECDEPSCWICLGAEGLQRTCKCPRLVHPKCMARWQLQQAGKL